MHLCVCIYIYIYIERERERIEKRSNPKVMNLLSIKVNIRMFQF